MATPRFQRVFMICSVSACVIVLMAVSWAEAPDVASQLEREGFSEWPSEQKVTKTDLPGGAMITFLGEKDKMMNVRVFIDGGPSPQYKGSRRFLNCNGEAQAATDPKFDALKASCMTLRGM